MKPYSMISAAFTAATLSLAAAGAGDPLRATLLIDRLEIRDDDAQTRNWDISGYIGYDLDKLYLYSEGDATSEGLEASQTDLVFSRAVAPFWDIQAGVAYDKTAEASRTWGEVAIAGLAPYWFEVRAALLLNAQGNVGLRLDAEYELLFTQRLVLTPKFEIDMYGDDDAALGIGSGLSSLEAGLRLRYEITREFAPYIGIDIERTYGDTYRLDPVNDTSWVVGIRIWF